MSVFKLKHFVSIVNSLKL